MRGKKKGGKIRKRNRERKREIRHNGGCRNR